MRPPASEEARFPIEIRAVLPEVDWAGAFSSFWIDPDTPRIDGPRWPTVIAVNRNNRSRVLLDTETDKEAIAQGERIRSDLESLGVRRWSQKYGVPWSFVTGERPSPRR